MDDMLGGISGGQCYKALRHKAYAAESNAAAKNPEGLLYLDLFQYLLFE